MDTLFKVSMHSHMTFALLLILSQLLFLKIKREPDFIKLVQKFKLLFLVQNLLLAALIFTGLLMMAVLKFSVWNVALILMIFVAVAVVVHQILIYKKMRPITSKDKEAQEEWKRYATKIYLAEVGAEIVVFVLAMVLR